MAITSARITVSTSAVALNAAETDTVSGMRLVVRNQDATNSVDLGPSGVTAGAGFELKAGTSQEFVLPSGELLYAIRSGGADVRVDVTRIGV
jgi:hypothetical protein